MTTFKLFFNGNSDIRRITLDVPDWDSFNRELVQVYPQQYHPELSVRYKDEEGDLITVTSQKEWATMMETLKGTSPIRLFIAEGKHNGQYFKDGPAPEAIGVYAQEEGEKKPVEETENLKTLEFAVPRCLERLLPGGKITPYNLPSWLEGCVEVKRVPGGDPTIALADVDIDLCSLFESLHKQALSLLNPEAEPQVIKKAKDYLQSMVDMIPNHPLANYNLACAHSLLGELQEAVESLKRAIEGGYSNLKHMIEDTDLNNLHPLPEFQALVDMLKGKQETKPEEKEVEMEEFKKEEKVEEKKEEKVEEKKVEEPKKEEKVEEKKELPPSKFESQHQTLAGMGFTNRDVNEALLCEFKGDMMKVVNALLSTQ